MSSVQHNVIKHKLGLLNLADELGNVSRACKVSDCAIYSREQLVKDMHHTFKGWQACCLIFAFCKSHYLIKILSFC
ncbi:hypothetical protein SAMN05421863_10147 [Nitrosomonas communis]|uniref:Transposase n=1 Tax=Nitrosomonas communis TaxID=44574 RepID=A0A1I4NA90_9PROT|nr:hypothetical protein [Nitrosomonas communis]SFM12421.1 hypothetical protein SAMN05421863_10147 [Nitrosomonas communis]